MPVWAERSASSLETKAAGALSVRVQKRGDEQGGVDFTVGADQRRLEPDNAVAPHLGRNVPGRNVAKNFGVGDVALGEWNTRWTRGPLKRKSRHTAFRMCPLVESKNLRQNGLIFAETRSQLLITDRRGRQYDIEYL